MDSKPTRITFRVPADVAKRLSKILESRYAPTMTQLILRGLELSMREWEKK
jgi:hypothetical protein